MQHIQTSANLSKLIQTFRSYTNLSKPNFSNPSLPKQIHPSLSKPIQISPNVWTYPNVAQSNHTYQLICTCSSTAMQYILSLNGFYLEMSFVSTTYHIHVHNYYATYMKGLNRVLKQER